MRPLLLLLVPVLLAQSVTKYSIHGRVEDDINHAAVAGADVTLKSAGKVLAATKTNDRGEYDFSDLTAGSYEPSVFKAGFFAQSYGEAVQVGGSPKIALSDITLVAERTLSGTVRWTDGDPVWHPMASVTVLSVTGGVDGVRFRNPRVGRIDEKGEFRITGLQPGRYVLYAKIVGQGGTPVMLERIALAMTVLGSTADQKPRIVPPVFYPGSDVPNANAALDLRRTAEFSGVSMVLEEKPGVDVDGIIEPATWIPAGKEVMVGLITLAAVPDLQNFIFATGEGLAGAPFHFHDVPPGNYLLLSSLSDNGYRRAAQPVTVGNSPVRINAVMPPPAPIVGTIEIEAPDGTVSPASGVGVSLTCDRIGMWGRSTKQTTDDKGQFRSTETAPGETYKLEIVSVPIDTYVAKITQDQRDFSGGVPASVFAGGGPVRILLKKDSGKINGQVQQSDGKPARGLVVLAPKNRKAADWYRTATTLRDGSFQLSSIAPGDYDLFALDQNEEDAYFDETYLRKFKPTAISILPLSTVSVTSTKVN